VGHQEAGAQATQLQPLLDSWIKTVSGQAHQNCVRTGASKLRQDRRVETASGQAHQNCVRTGTSKLRQKRRGDGHSRAGAQQVMQTLQQLDLLCAAIWQCTRPHMGRHV